MRSSKPFAPWHLALLALSLASFAGQLADGRLHVVPRSQRALVKPSKAISRTRNPAARAAPLFPSLNNCAQTPDSTPLRIHLDATQATPASTWCFSFYTAAPTASDAPCGAATSLERLHFWASHINRSNISRITIRTDLNERVMHGSWVSKGSRENPFRDELVFSKLKWSTAYIDSVNPRICLTLRHGASLDALCQGPRGRCTVGLFSTGDKGAKCCPVYTVVVA